MHEGPEGDQQRPRRRIPVGALVLITLGVVLLLQTTGVISWRLWEELWRFWPAIIIAIGVNLLLGRRSPWATVLIIAAILAGSVAGAYALADGVGEPVVTSLIEPLGDLRSVNVDIAFGAGRLSVGSLPAGSPNAVEASFETPGRGATAVLKRSGDSGDLRITMEGRSWFPWLDDSSRADWEISLSQGPELSIGLAGGAAEITLDLHDLQVSDLDVDTGAADVNITMPADAGRVEARIDAGASDLNVIIPEGVAARITKSSGLSSFDIDTARFPESDGVYVSPDFQTAENRLTIVFRVGASSVTVR